MEAGKHLCKGGGGFDEMDRPDRGVHNMSGRCGRAVCVARSSMAHHSADCVGDGGDDSRLGNRRYQGVKEYEATRLEALLKEC